MPRRPRAQAGSFTSFTLTYTAGVYDIDDSGSLRVCFRFASDQGNPQFGAKEFSRCARAVPSGDCLKA